MRVAGSSTHRNVSPGFTLWELLCTLSIAAMLTMLGAPAMQDTVLDVKLATSVRGFVAAVQLARTEAVKRGRTVVLCQSVDLGTCAGSADYSGGWIVFADHERERQPQRSAGDPLLRADKPPLRGTILANRPAFEFRPLHKRATNGTVTFCDRRGPDKARAVIISYTGRPRVARQGAGRPTLTCPGV